jgi:hydrogenase expression/formation protein HypE
MCGARPAFISCGFIIEEGFLQSDLKKIVASMQRCAIENDVQIVTGDTKVIERHEGKNIFINTSGIGIPMTRQKIRPSSIKAADAIILTGDIGRHGMAVMAQREGLRFSLPLLSDCASLLPPIQALLSAGTTIHCMRDLTRGGLATALVELAQDSGMNFLIDEEKIPISDGVSASCEILGLDPLYVANEGRCIAFIPQSDVQQALKVLSTFSICTDACVIGQVIEQPQEGSVVIENGYGTRRFLFQLSSEQLPRIC